MNVIGLPESFSDFAEKKLADVTFEISKAIFLDSLFETRLKMPAVFLGGEWKYLSQPVSATFAASEFYIKIKPLRNSWMEMERSRRADRSTDTCCDLHAHGRSVYFDK